MQQVDAGALREIVDTEIADWWSPFVGSIDDVVAVVAGPFGSAHFGSAAGAA